MQVKTSLPIVEFGDIHDYINTALILSKKLIYWLPDCSAYERVRMKTLWMVML